MSHTPLFKSHANMGSSEGEKTHQFLYTSIYYPNILTSIYTLHVHHYLIKLPIHTYIRTYVCTYVVLNKVGCMYIRMYTIHTYVCM